MAEFAKLSPDNDTRRNLLLFKGYLDGRIMMLQEQGKTCPAEQSETELAISELQFIYDTILPALFKSAKN